MPSPPDVLILGAGLTGLAAACHLEAAGLSCLLLEASDAPGGRIRTDAHQGFLLDRGFQLFLTAYPDAQALLNYEPLDLRPFTPGANIFLGPAKGWTRLSDPRRDPAHALSSLFSSATTAKDKFLAAKLLLELLPGSPEKLLPPDLISSETTPTDPRRLSALEFLRVRGFSEAALSTFLQPFLAGVFLENELATAAGFMNYCLKMFATGEAALPAQGMGQIPLQLAARLKRSTIRFHAHVTSLHGNTLTLSTGESLAPREGGATLLALDEPAARALLRQPPPQVNKATTTLYFACPADRIPFKEPLLHLNGSQQGFLNNITIPSLLSPHYAPTGQHLIAASCVGLPLSDPSATDPLTPTILQEAATWFGPNSTAHWTHLRTYRIPHALPDARPASKPLWQSPSRISPHLYIAGDHQNSPSQQGALASARQAAHTILHNLTKRPN